MNSSILTAIESLCDDIATNTNAEENKKRADAALSLAFAGMFTPSEYKDEAETETDERENKITKPKPGDRFGYNGMEFVILGEEQGGILAITAKLLDNKMPFDEENRNDWRDSSLQEYLNGEFLKKFNKGDLLPIVSDLTADDGMKDYGTSEDYIGLLSCDLYRKYRDLVPKYKSWWWTCTPYSCLPGYASNERIVLTDGSLDGNGAYYAIGVAPACIFNRSIFE